MVEYVNVQLKTRPLVSVMIPKGYEEKARKLIDIAIQEPRKLSTMATINEHPYLRNIGILSRTADLANETNPVNANELQDIVLLRIGIYANKKLMNSSDLKEREKVLEVDSNLIRILEELEKHKS